MKKLPITATELIQGKILEIETIDKEDLRIAELGFSQRINRFTIWFNGQLIYSCKGFKSINSKLSKLNTKFPLEFKN